MSIINLLTFSAPHKSVKLEYMLPAENSDIHCVSTTVNFANECPFGLFVVCGLHQLTAPISFLESECNLKMKALFITHH